MGLYLPSVKLSLVQRPPGFACQMDRNLHDVNTPVAKRNHICRFVGIDPD